MRKTTRILVADDSRSMRSLIRTAFPMGSRQIEFIEAADGEEALHVYRSHRCDIALLDVMMPAMDGLTVLSELTRYDEDAFVVMITGDSDPFLADDALAMGAREFVRKPITQRAALGILQAHDARRRPAAVTVVDGTEMGPVTLKFGLDALRIPHRMARATNAHEALYTLGQLRCDIVFVDTRLPGVDGPSAVSQIKSSHPGIYTVMFSDQCTVEAVKRAMEHGADDYLLKSIDLEHLKKMWSRFLKYTDQA